MGRLEGKVTIITGAGRGIGQVMARRFAAEGAKVAITSLAPGIVGNVGDEAQIKAAVAKTVETLGTVDIAQKALDAGQASIPPIPVPRMGSLEDDIVPVALFLVSPEARYVTGYSYFADGGHKMDCGR